MGSPSKTPPLTSRGHLAAGQAAFNRGEFFLAHEHWEETWRDAKDPDRRILQGLIQIAAGCHHWTEGRRVPGGRLLTKGAAKLTQASGATIPELAALPYAALLSGISRLLDAATSSDATPTRLKL